MKHELHIHSTDSDGAHSKEELLKIANEKGLDYIAFTDHNTLDNLDTEKLNQQYEEKYGEQQKTIIIPGIEIDTYDDDKYHLLGYDIKVFEGMRKILKDIQSANHEICLEVIQKIKENDGIELDINEILKRQNSPYLSKSSIINYLVYIGVCDDYRIASYKYVGRKSKNYIPRKTLSLKSATEMVLESGGIPIIAHPYRRLTINTMFNLEDNVDHYKKIGIAGIEAKSPSHSVEQEFYIKELCKANDMIYTGGSDYHSGNTSSIGSDDEDLINGLLNYKERKGR